MASYKYTPYNHSRFIQWLIYSESLLHLLTVCFSFTVLFLTTDWFYCFFYYHSSSSFTRRRRRHYCYSVQSHCSQSNDTEIIFTTQRGSFIAGKLFGVYCFTSPIRSCFNIYDGYINGVYFL